MEIDGSTALITGASMRIGRAVALALAEGGCNIAVHYYSSENEVMKTRDMARSIGIRCEAVRADLANADECIRLWVEIAEKLNAMPSIIINNASVFKRADLGETTAEDFDHTMAVNVRAPMLLAQMMNREMPEGKIGKVVNINDRRLVYKSRFAYGVSKAALSGLTRSLALSLAPRIQVNELRLGPVLPLSDSGAQTLGPSTHTLGPAERMGRPEEVAQAVVSLIQNDYINGATLNIDGGLSALER